LTPSLFNSFDVGSSSTVSPSTDLYLVTD